MSAPITSAQPPSVRAEAAAWVARLRGPDRDAATEAAFRRWVESDPAHAAAFDRATEIWQAIGGAAALAPERARSRQQRARVLASLAAVAVLAGLGGAYALRDPSYATHIGEQRSIRLADGSRIALNTDTRIVVRYTEGRRDIRLVRGEAQFDVAKNPGRPFVVTAEGQQVRALGTSFIVRDHGKAIAVTLLEGKVSVTPAREADAKVVTLQPGQRLRAAPAAMPVVDRPKLEAVTAWRTGEILLDNTTLADAVAEMNRYSPKPLALENEEIGSLRISGIFRSGESEAFARTISVQYQLAVIEQPGRILLAEALTTP